MYETKLAYCHYMLDVNMSLYILMGENTQVPAYFPKTRSLNPKFQNSCLTNHQSCFIVFAQMKQYSKQKINQKTQIPSSAIFAQITITFLFLMLTNIHGAIPSPRNSNGKKTNIVLYNNYNFLILCGMKPSGLNPFPLPFRALSLFFS